MKPKPQNFFRTAERLSRNPLGIIALFIVLVYGIAGTVMGVTAEMLSSSERIPIIWFIVIYPVLVLVAFYRLVALHHTKLYSPRDFPNDDGFFRALTPNEQKERLRREAQEIGAIEHDGDENVGQENSNDVKQLDDKPDSPEPDEPKPDEPKPDEPGLDEPRPDEPKPDESKSDEPNAGAAKSSANTIASPSANLIRTYWMVAEELAIRELEAEYQTTIRRQVMYAGRYEADGIFLTDENRKVNIVEVKFSGHVKNLLNRARQAGDQLKRVAEIKEQENPHFIFAFVVQNLRHDQIERHHKHILEVLGMKKGQIELRIYDFDQLTRKYGIATVPPHQF